MTRKEKIVLAFESFTVTAAYVLILSVLFYRTLRAVAGVA